MLDLSATVYQWLKAFHLIAVIAWMAGLLYMPRLFVYHCEVLIGSEASEKYKVMERRLFRAIMTPAMTATVGLGAVLLAALPPSAWAMAWLWIKLAAALGMLAMHFAMALWRRDFAADRNRRPQTFYRGMNEVPTLLMIVIVIMAVVEPF
jgi:putative membrane protein